MIIISMLASYYMFANIVSIYKFIYCYNIDKYSIDEISYLASVLSRVILHNDTIKIRKIKHP